MTLSVSPALGLKTMAALSLRSLDLEHTFQVLRRRPDRTRREQVTASTLLALLLPAFAVV